jgi:hypothetical protein
VVSVFVASGDPCARKQRVVGCKLDTGGLPEPRQKFWPNFHADSLSVDALSKVLANFCPRAAVFACLAGENGESQTLASPP